MSRAAWAVAAAAGITLVAGVGCYSPPQYAPAYGYPSAPAYPAAPGGSYIVPNGSPGMLGTPSGMPSGPGPTLAPPINGAGGDAPPYGTFDSSPTPAGPAVPNYSDPGPENFDNGGGGFGADPGAGAGSPSNDGFQPPASNDAPFMEGTAAPRRLGTEQVAVPAAGTDYFAGIDRYRRSDRPSAPAEVAKVDSGIRPAAFNEDQRPAVSEDFGFDPITTPDAQPAATAASAGDEGFAYEPAGYRWLRGVIDYDPTARNWHVIYGLTPNSNDKYGGSLTLADSGRLSEFRDNDVVYLEGVLDPGAGRDPLGKPLYRVTNAELIGRYE